MDMLADADITVNGITATASVQTRMGNTIPITVPIPANTSDDFSITIAANSVGSNAATTGPCVYVSNVAGQAAPTVSFSLPDGLQTGTTSEVGY